MKAIRVSIAYEISQDIMLGNIKRAREDLQTHNMSEKEFRRLVARRGWISNHRMDSFFRG